jgi:hypothetical protein
LPTSGAKTRAVERTVDRDERLVLLGVRLFLQDAHAALVGPVQPADLEPAFVAAVDLGLDGRQVDVEHLGVLHLDHERAALAQHAHVEVLATRAVELVLARLERRADDVADQLLHGVARQLPEAFAARAAAPAPRMPLALGAEEDGLRQIARELAVAAFEEDLDPGSVVTTSAAAGARFHVGLPARLGAGDLVRLFVRASGGNGVAHASARVRGEEDSGTQA